MEILDYIVNFFSPKDVVGEYGRTKLHNASLSGDLNTIIYLISYYEKFNEKTKKDFLNKKYNNGMTALHWAAKNFQMDIFDMLVKYASKQVHLG